MAAPHQTNESQDQAALCVSLHFVHREMPSLYEMELVAAQVQQVAASNMISAGESQKLVTNCGTLITKLDAITHIQMV
jgi:hypothetical protein